MGFPFTGPGGPSVKDDNREMIPRRMFSVNARRGRAGRTFVFLLFFPPLTIPTRRGTISVKHRDIIGRINGRGLLGRKEST